MATFKVGDRVRIRRDTDCQPHLKWMLGQEVVIVDEGDIYGGWTISLRDTDGCPVVCDSSALEPLTPPAQDEWADAKVREVTKPVYTEPERVKERAHG